MKVLFFAVSGGVSRGRGSGRRWVRSSRRPVRGQCDRHRELRTISIQLWPAPAAVAILAQVTQWADAMSQASHSTKSKGQEHRAAG